MDKTIIGMDFQTQKVYLERRENLFGILLRNILFRKRKEYKLRILRILSIFRLKPKNYYLTLSLTLSLSLILSLVYTHTRDILSLISRTDKILLSRF
uniref:Uncharacterized protein n=1 Tax=Ackermannviridae sp. TaxID=2831612 RepID=A0A8S5VMX5_9CAUD|nr:MAG TPA: hypothetical protein [Ackermannviridae sp.]